jgi:DMSO/TMAO reductase YedYZ heme-binding membrane subunit
MSIASPTRSDARAPDTVDPTRRRTLPIWPIVFAASAVAGLLGRTWLDGGSDFDRLTLLNRYLARMSFLVFCAIFAASPLAAWLPGPATRGLLRLRRSLGLAYALIMAAHVGAIFALHRLPGAQPLEPVAGVLGGLGFVLIGALAATSSDAAVHRLGFRTWKRLHRTALYYLWAIYTVTYLGRIQGGLSEYAPGLVAVFALLGLRLSVRFRPARIAGDEPRVPR